MALTDPQLKALALLKTRTDATNKDLARAAGVSERTICNWKNTQEWKDALAMLPEAILKDTTFLKAANGDIQALDKFMRWFGKEHRPEEDDFARSLNMTEEDQERIAKDAYEYWKNRGTRAVSPAVVQPAF